MNRRRALVVACLAMFAAACGPADGGEDAGLPDVRLEPLADEPEISLADIDGPAVLNIWATTCAPCVRELPDFEQVASERTGVKFYGINRGEDVDRIAGFFDEHSIELTYDQYLDREGYVSTELAVSAMPTTFLIDADGEIALTNRGTMSADALNDALDDLLGVKA